MNTNILSSKKPNQCVFLFCDYGNCNSLNSDITPESGMLYQSSRKCLFRLDKTLYIGDDPKDMKAAENVGLWGMFLGPKNKLVRKNPRVKKI